MPRVLHINDYASTTLGGAEVLMARTIALLQSVGWETRVFSEADLVDPRLTARRYINNRFARRALRKTLDEFRPDVVHVHNYYHLLSPGILLDLSEYREQRSARVVMTAHDYHLVCPNSGGNWFRNGPRLVDVDRLRSWWYLLSRRWDHRGQHYSLLKLAQHIWHYRIHNRRDHVDLVICTCRFLQRLVDSVGVRSVFISNPNPTTIAGPAPTRGSELTLLFAGRAEPEKGLRRFLEILPGDFSGRFLIVGDGADRSGCEDLVRSRNMSDRVTFLGRKTHDETVRLIASAHVVVIPSLLFETYPLVAQEALSVGTNVLAADYGGMREVVLDAGVGYRFHPDRPVSLIDQLQLIQRDFTQGRLNTFDVSAFLAARSEAAYLTALLQAYSVAIGTETMPERRPVTSSVSR